MGKTIESRVAETILQREETIKIGNKTFNVAPPSVATLILLSETISLLPAINLSEDEVIEGVLSTAKEFRLLGDIVAILILGAKHIDDLEEIKTKKWFKKARMSRVRKRDRIARLALEELSPREMQALLGRLLSSLQTGDFFGITTFLTGINLTKKTREVEETEPIQSGQ